MSTTPGANANAVAEATVGLALNVLRHLPRCVAMLKRDRTWKRESLMGRELGESVVGIVGFGQIGRLVARYFAVFGARVIVTDIDLAAVADSPYPAVGMEELLRTSDVISLHCPLTPETRHLIDRERLRLVKPAAIVVNTARGALVDEDALVDPVPAGRLAGAALDVYDWEPPDEVYAGTLHGWCPLDSAVYVVQAVNRCDPAATFASRISSPVKEQRHA